MIKRKQIKVKNFLAVSLWERDWDVKTLKKVHLRQMDEIFSSWTRTYALEKRL